MKRPMSASNPGPRSSSRLAGLKSYLSTQNLRTVIPTRRALRRGESGYVDGQTTTQSWSQWAGQKIRRNGSDITTMDEVTLFPGWASRCLTIEQDDENAFDLVVFVSGYATTRRSPEFLTRSQRAFLRLARGYASLPKLPGQQSPVKESSMIEIDGIKLPPRPEEISDDFEMELDKEFDHMRHPQKPFTEEPYDSESDPQPAPSRFDTSAPFGSALLHKQHSNLEARLRPFWSSALASRTVQISIFAVSTAPGNSDSKRDALEHGPLYIEHVVTGPDGAFANPFKIPWQKLSRHPLAQHRPFDRLDIEQELLVAAKLLPEPAPTPAYMIPADVPKHISLVVPITSSPVRVITDIDDTVKLSNITSGARAVFRNVFVKDLEETTIPEMGTWYQAMWRRGVRFHYVSNSPFELLPVIKEFLRISDLPQGSICLKSYNGRSFFNALLSDPATRKRANVVDVLDGFPDSKFILIGDSGEQDLELYASIAMERPQQILAVFIRDVHDAGLADATGSMANLMTTKPPVKKTSLPAQPLATRPHPLRSMSDPDTLNNSELYVANSGSSMKRRPTPKFTLPPQSFSSFDIPENVTPESKSKFTPRMSVDSMSSAGSSSSSLSRNFRRATGQTTPPMTEAEKRRFELQNRVNKARLMMGPDIVLRMFRLPEECIETEQLLEPLKDRNGRPT
ncbi:hypothetical protein DEU56DRAFT_209858 [Suillus clintonianus]|uniref:uncharacterized protein n=1 Tax=Suillus clintonianus TaxID=1904413 RepID=UPI001B87887C|nr:uncharacterized protein DEU56DRAFT_209858 [Suillus clintonianus]KAG2144583.1 hypothetical protein DEU56DRAFT_209858 [Suillus clintonianus]